MTKFTVTFLDETNCVFVRETMQPTRERVYEWAHSQYEESSVLSVQTDDEVAAEKHAAYIRAMRDEYGEDDFDYDDDDLDDDESPGPGYVYRDFPGQGEY